MLIEREICYYMRRAGAVCWEHTASDTLSRGRRLQVIPGEVTCGEGCPLATLMSEPLELPERQPEQRRADQRQCQAC